MPVAASVETPVEFIGFIGNNNGSETTPRTGPLLDVTYIETLAKAHENAGFDRALLAFHSTLPDCLQVGQHVASVTERLNVFIAQRPGFTAPTLLARQFATLDHLAKGRISLNVITGGDSVELAQDGNTIDDKDERYARTSEFLDVVRAEWTSAAPFDYDGKYYQVKRGFSQLKPYQKNGIPVFIAGASDAAVEVAGRHADVFALWGETYDEVRKVIAKVRAACAKNGRAAPRFSLSFRPILADTEEKAWAKAEATLARAKAVQDKTGFVRKPGGPANEGSKRLLALAAQGERLDKRLWTGMAALTDARGNSTSLVGTPQQVAESLAEYYDLGIDIFLIRGFDPLIDAIEYGRELIPLTRKLVAERARTRSLAAE
jgi:alkanesulfonate monooxygenase